ncbi:uncharacterized protein TNCV_3453651 [Trichonephila clavipes]|nr:uncharacterized protein TNCV_3453651 [Trichonephila clavipes]
MHDRAFRHTSSVGCLETFHSIFAVNFFKFIQTRWMLNSPNLPYQMIPDRYTDWIQLWGSGRPIQFSRAWRRPWVGVKGSTCNGLYDPKCPSARSLRMLREDTRVPNEGATCAWMAADEAVNCMRAFLTMLLSSRRLDFRGRPEPGLQVNDIYRIHCCQHLIARQSERPN